MKTSRRQFLATAAGAVAAPALLPGVEAVAAPPQLGNLGIDWGFPEDAVRVGLNENPLGVSPVAARAMLSAVVHGNRYLRSSTLIDKLAKLHGVDNDWITFGCGSTELLMNAPWGFAQGGEIVTGKEAYRDLPNESQQMGITTHMVPLDSSLTHDLGAMANAINDRTRIINVTNPNNPTGTLLPVQDLRAFARGVPAECVFLIDEAYIHFAPDEEASDLVREFDNVLILRTFSKIFGMAGIRVGYAVGHPDMIGKLRRYGVRNNVNTVGFVGAIAALDDTDHMEKYRNLLREGKDFYKKELDAAGIDHLPSWTPFFLINTHGDGQQVVDALVEHSVFIRRGVDWDLPTYVRVTYGTMEENLKVLAALKQVMPEGTVRQGAA